MLEGYVICEASEQPFSGLDAIRASVINWNILGMLKLKSSSTKLGGRPFTLLMIDDADGHNDLLQTGTGPDQPSHDLTGAGRASLAHVTPQLG